MSQPKMTSQKPKPPPPTAESSFSRLTYFPRHTPSMSKPPTLAWRMPRSSSQDSSAEACAPAETGAGLPVRRRGRVAR